MADNYKITWSEDGSTTVSTAEEIHKNYGGESKQDEFIAALLSTPILRSTLMIGSIEKLSAETLFAEADAELTERQKELDAAKDKVQAAFLEILKEIPSEEVDKGEYITTSKAKDAVEISMVEFWIRKAKPNLTKLIADHKDELPTHVGYDLERIQAKRKKGKSDSKK